MTDFREGDEISVTVNGTFKRVHTWEENYALIQYRSSYAGSESNVTMLVPLDKVTLIKRKPKFEVGQNIVFGVGEEPPVGTLLKLNHFDTSTRFRTVDGWLGPRSPYAGKWTEYAISGFNYTIIYLPPEGE